MNVPLSFYCVTCQCVGDRKDSYRKLAKGQVPGYTDLCPRCAGDDIFIYDPRYSSPGMYNDYVEVDARKWQLELNGSVED